MEMEFQGKMNRHSPQVSLIIVNYNGKHLLKGCLDSLLSLSYPKAKLEIIMVDNCSTDGSLDFVKKRYPKVKIIKNDVNNYCRANNLGIRQAKSKFIAFLNNDTKVDKNWLAESIKVITQDKATAAVGSKILFLDGKINSVAHYELPNYYWADLGFKEDDRGQYNKICEVNSICGGAALFRKDVFKKIGFFDEDFQMFVEDVDVSIRLKKKGWKIFYSPKSIVYHKFHGTASDDLANFYVERNRLLLIAKHYPEKLGETILGRGYFTITNNINNYNDIHNIFPLVFSKLLKHHKVQEVNAILPDLFDNLKKITNFEKDYLIQALNNQNMQLQIKDGDLAQKGILLQEKDMQIKQSAEQLQQKVKNLQLKDQELLQQELLLQEKDIQLKHSAEQFHQKVHELQLKDHELQSKDVLLQQKEADLQNRNEQIKALSYDFTQKEEELRARHTEINNLNKQIHDFYASETFRFVVHPAWILLNAMKKIKRILLTPINFHNLKINMHSERFKNVLFLPLNILLLLGITIFFLIFIVGGIKIRKIFYRFKKGIIF
jgi:GT2 family glycosyltransferase